jgi:hypothetical protein
MHSPLARALRKTLIACIAGILLAGCQTAAQRQLQSMRAGNLALVEQAKSCTTEAYNAPEAALIRPHVPLNARDVTLSQLSDQSLATPQEADAILAVHPRVQACRNAVLDGLLNTTPSVIPILTKEFAGADDDTIALVQRKISWGDRVRRARDRFISAETALQSEEQHVMAGLERSHEAEPGAARSGTILGYVGRGSRSGS